MNTLLQHRSEQGVSARAVVRQFQCQKGLKGLLYKR